MSGEVKLIIVDFDGTLFDTFEANFEAYHYACGLYSIELTKDVYRQNFGYRFDDLMNLIGIDNKEITKLIKETKEKVYPDFFHLIRVNKILFDFIRAYKISGYLVAIASTASKNNILNVLKFFDLSKFFDLVVTGEDVKSGKPAPDVYLYVMEYFKISPDVTLIFEDSKVGFDAASAAGAKYVTINQSYYGD